MSRFRELVQTWNDILGRHFAHRDECLSVANKLHEVILKEWEWPEELLAVYRIGREPGEEPEKKRIFREAFQVEEDGSWFFGLEITTPTRYSDVPNVRYSSNNLSIMFYVGIKKLSDGVGICIARGSQYFPVHFEQHETFGKILGLLADGMKEEMQATYPSDDAENARRYRFGFAR